LVIANLKVAFRYFLIVIVSVNLTLAYNTSASTSTNKTQTFGIDDSRFIDHEVDT